MPVPNIAAVDADIAAFTNSLPPPPYPGAGPYDLTPTPQSDNRPRLPIEARNPHLANLPDDVNIVKFQTIVREGREIVVGRIKVPTTGNNSHAFVLRRYDTDAISLTTMYKVAFPSATEEDERREMDWIKSSYDTRNTNGGRGSEAVKLAGQWVSRHLAIHLAPAYGIADLVTALARAVPDPNVAYRKSQRSQAAADEMAKPRAEVPVPTATPAAAPISKRARRSSPPAPNTEPRDQAEPVRQLTVEATTTVTAPSAARVDMEAEIESAKQLVLDLKRELRMRVAAGESLQDQGFDIGESSRGRKRGQGEDEAVEVSGGVGAGRIVKTSKRVERTQAGQAAKKVAWGALIFGLGVGAASLLPQLAASYF